MKRRDFIVQSGLLASAFAVYGSSALVGEKHPSLKEHRVAKIETLKVPYSWPRLVGKNARLGVHGKDKNATVTRITTDQGAVGFGTGGTREKGDHLIGKMVSELIDPDRGILQGVPASMDLALHDLAGIILDIPVYRMLGAKGPKSMPTYSGMIYFDELEPEAKPAGIDRVLENCAWDLDYGYRKLKVKIGRGSIWYSHDDGLRKDIEVVNTIYDTFKDRGVEILVDANDGYSMADCTEFMEGIRGVPLYWLEEPFVEDAVQTRLLKKWMMSNGYETTYLADGERKPNVDLCMDMAEDGSLDVFLGDLVGFGFTPWREAIPLLKKYGKFGSPHGWATFMKSFGAAQLSAGLGQCCVIEGATTECKAIDFGGYKIADGMLTVSDAPGFGMKLMI